MSRASAVQTPNADGPCEPKHPQSTGKRRISAWATAPTLATYWKTDMLILYPASFAIGSIPQPERYYYLAGAGWRRVGSLSTTVGIDAVLKPGRVLDIKKRAGSADVDWILRR